MAFDKDAFLTALDSMITVLELNDLVKAIEEKFGVSAAAMAAPAAAGAGAGAAAAEEKTEFNVVLTDAGANKVSVIKAVRGNHRSGPQRKPGPGGRRSQERQGKALPRQTPKPLSRSWWKLAPRPNSSNSVPFKGLECSSRASSLWRLSERTRKPGLALHSGPANSPGFSSVF